MTVALFRSYVSFQHKRPTLTEHRDTQNQLYRRSMTVANFPV
jgi:hypothetical protein